MSFINYWERRYERMLNLYGNSYLSVDYNRWSFFYEQKNILDWVDKEKNHFILDVGCNVGIFSRPLGEKNKIIGVDLIFNPLVYARQNRIIPVQADANRLAFRSEIFDLVLCINMLQHEDNFKPCVSELIRVTKREGQIIILTLNSHSILRKISGVFTRHSRFIRTHGIKELISIFKKNNFRDVRILYEFYPVLLRKISKDANWLFKYLATCFAIKAVK